MGENTKENLTRNMQPWGSLRRRIRATKAALKNPEGSVVWAEPTTHGTYEVKIIPVEHFRGAPEDAIWG